MYLDTADLDPVLISLVRRRGAPPTAADLTKGPPAVSTEVLFHQPRNFECHITIEPVFDQLLEDVKAVAEAFDFRVADLIFQKRAEDTPERSKRDTFMTRNTVSGEGYNELITGAMQLRDMLENGLHVKVWRIKVEEILFDRRYRGVVDA